MGPLLIAFVFAWVLRHWWDGRKNDHANPDNDYRQRVRNAAVRGASRRYSAGWAAFQLRHGWKPMIQDVRDGWDGAHTATRAWRDGSAERPGFRQAWVDGWNGGAKPLPAGNTPPDGQSATAKPTPEAPQIPAPPVPTPTIVVINNPHGGTVTTPTVNAGEMTSLDAYRRLLQETVTTAAQRLDLAGREVAAAERDIATYDSAQASLAASGLGPQTTGGLADLLEAAQERKRGAERTRTRAEQEMATAQNLLAALASTGQDTMQDAAAAATERANDTNFYVPQ